MSVRHAVIAFALLTCAHSAHAHGIAGNRFFVGTLTFDDPAVADEAVLPNFSMLNQPVEGGNAVNNRINWSFVRLLTPTLQVSINSGWINQSWPTARASGFDTTDIGIKGEIFRNNEHEALVSAGVAWGIGHSGAAEVGADEPNSIQPGFSLARASVICLIGSLGHDLSPLPARLWMSNRLERRATRLPPT